MLQALSQNRGKRQTHSVVAIPAPLGGLNTRDDITKIGPEDAWILDNVVVTEEGVRTRDGHESFATGLGAAVQTLMVYLNPNGTEELYAATTDSIFDITAGGSIGSADVSSLTNGEWDWVNFTTSGGSYLVMANGADSLRNWDGSSWTTPTINNVTSSTLIQLNVHMNRIWMVQKNKMDVWYLPTGAISGDATKLPLGEIFKAGGHLMAMGSWTRDGADGMDDMAVFITSEGELAVYSGTDPSSADTWALVGVTRISHPIGRRCFVKIGGDVAILTTRGVVSLAGVIGLAYSGQSKAAITDKVRREIITAAVSDTTSRGWHMIESQTDGLLLVNVPIQNGTTYYQFVMGTGTKAWSRWTGLNGRAWAHFGDKLYFGDDSGTVWKVTGETDNDEAVDAIIGPGFAKFGTDRTKNVRRVRPLMSGPPGYKPRIAIRSDFDTSPVTETASTYSTTGPKWDVSPWDTTPWGVENTVLQYWQAATGQGYVIAPVVIMSTVQRVTWHGCRMAVEIGDNL